MTDMQDGAGEQQHQGASAAGASNAPGSGGHSASSDDTRQDAGVAGAPYGQAAQVGAFQEQWQSQQPQHGQPYRAQQPWQPQQGQQPWQPQQPQSGQIQFQPQYGYSSSGDAQHGGPRQGGSQFGGGQQDPRAPMGGQQFGQPGHGTAPGGPGQSMPWGGSQMPAGGAAVNFRAADGSPDLGLVALGIAGVAQLFVVIGSIAPWASIFGISISGVRGDGKITIVLALVALAMLALSALGKVPRAVAWGVVAISAIELIIGFADSSDYMAWGLLLVILFSFIALVSAAAGALLPRKGSAGKGGPGSFTPTPRA